MHEKADFQDFPFSKPISNVGNVILEPVSNYSMCSCKIISNEKKIISRNPSWDLMTI